MLILEKGARCLAWSEELDVPAEGEVTRELKPVPRPVPATR
ncbi:hypothetical protein [Myxococcus sp. RHSTA-1-4]|nr:hypothetical protein [Myxococcus sp. RHSTA-1-4]